MVRGLLVMLMLSMMTLAAAAQDSLKTNINDPLSTHFTAYDSSQLFRLMHSKKLTAIPSSIQSERSKANLNGKIPAIGTLRDSQQEISQAENTASKKINLVAQQPGIAVTSIESKLLRKVSAAKQDSSFSDVALLSNKIPALRMPATSLPGFNQKLPAGFLPGAGSPGGLPNDPLSSLTSELPKVPSLETLSKPLSFPGRDLGSLNRFESPVTSDMNKAAMYKKDVSGLMKGDSASQQKVKQRIENELKNTEGVKSLSVQDQKISSYTKLAEAGPAGFQKEGLSMAEKPAVDHFAGHEKVLQNAMSEISKLKQKYHSINSLTEIPKRVPNPMHGKPLIERLVPGFTFQVLARGHRPTIDFNPFIAYRLTAKLTAGAGWNERLDVHNFQVHNKRRYYGPRTFGDYKIKNGLSFRLELETMNTYIPPNQIFIFGDQPKKWVWNSFAGVKRDYVLFRWLKGNAQMLYNINTLFDRHHLNLYGDPVSARIGFELPTGKHMFKKMKVPPMSRSLRRMAMSEENKIVPKK